MLASVRIVAAATAVAAALVTVPPAASAGVAASGGVAGVATSAGAAGPAATAAPTRSAGATTRARAATPVARVYVSLPRRGRAAPSAALVARGLRAATKARDAKAGGHRIKLVWLDDARGNRWDAKKVVANARRAAADPTAIAYVGEGDSEATALSMPIVNRAGLVHLSPVSTATSLTSADRAAELQPTGARTFFRPIPDDGRQGEALVAYARNLRVRKRVLLVDDGGLYGRGLTASFAEHGPRRGVRTIGRRVVTPDGRGLATAVRYVKAERPRAIVYGGSPSSGAAKVIRALHAASPRTLIFAGEALANDAFARRLGRAQSVMRLTTPAAHANPRARRSHRLGRRPAAFTVFAHNGMTALLRAIDRAARRGPVTRESVRSAVFDGSLQTGLSGRWNITPTGDSGYGVFNTIRLARGRVLTPGARAVTRLVKRERDRLRRRANGRSARSTVTRAAPRTIDLSTAAASGADLLQTVDIETALMLVQRERVSLLETQLSEQIKELQARNAQTVRLTELLGRLQAQVAGFSPESGLSSLEDAHAAIARVKREMASATNSQQMDMLRLQSLTNRRNEAFDLMASFVKKMQDARNSIVRNMR
ncbi:MAG: branched-chain amino acid ABC transporter substrate-binding protein [Solirubrobacteraceae bacterium]